MRSIHRSTLLPLFFFSAAVSSVALGAVAAAAPPPPVTAPVVMGGDKVTLRKLHEADETGIQMGKLAGDKGSTRSVRDYGRTLVTDHTRAERQLDELLRRRGSDLASLGSATSADADHELLATKVGIEFDRAFAEQMLRDQQKVLDLLSSARLETPDDTLRTLYEDLAKTTAAHKRVAEMLLAATARS